MGSVAAARGAFDASKSGSVPENALCSPPKNEPAVYVKLVSPDIGYGVFAARNFEKDEFIFHEAPLIRPTNFCQVRSVNDDAHARAQWNRLAHKLGDTSNNEYMKMRFAFPKLAAQMGKTLPTYDDVLNHNLAAGLGTNLVHGQVRAGPGYMVTREEYTEHVERVQTEVLARGGGPRTDIPCRVKVGADFFRDYAFQANGVGRLENPRTLDPRLTRKATIYLLAGLINHCCSPTRRLQKKTKTGAGPPNNGADHNDAEDSDAENSDAADNNDAGIGTGTSNAGTGNEADTGSLAGPSGVNNPTLRVLKAPTKAKAKVDEITFVADDNAAKGKNSKGDGSNEAVAEEEGTDNPHSPPGPPPQNGHPPPGPNCEWRIGPGGLARFIKRHHIAVQAKRPIMAGEELTWDYGKEDQRFTCLCAVCNQGPRRPCAFL